jgi:hypothetical protein
VNLTKGQASGNETYTTSVSLKCCPGLDESEAMYSGRPRRVRVRVKVLLRLGFMDARDRKSPRDPVRV